ncbi:MAG TPA: hypothetical protein VMF59_01460 [Bacteroidota bacterium]|nr:hypothetical protein [Bacteroidota bacterium]
MLRTIPLLVLALALCSCGGYTSGTVQKAEKGFLKFVGNTTGVMISVDDGTLFPPDPLTDRYEVQPGRHTVKVYRNSQIVVDRTVIIDNHTTFEIEIP